MTSVRRNRAPLLVPLVFALCACSSTRTVFPPTGSITLTLADPGLDYQTATTPARQQIRWTLLSVNADIEGFGNYEFLGVRPCTFTANIQSIPFLQSVCGGSGLVLGTGGTRTVTVHLVLTAIEVRQAFRPNLPATGDYDGDGIPNGVDNCPLIPNPDQTPYPGQTTGVACTFYDPATAGFFLDNDGDGVDDSFDNCAWVPNPAQTDSNSDGIGDACEQDARVVLTTIPARITLPALTVAMASDAVTRLTVRFDDRTALVGCDPAFTRCDLNPAGITVVAQ